LFFLGFEYRVFFALDLGSQFEGLLGSHPILFEFASFGPLLELHLLIQVALDVLLLVFLSLLFKLNQLVSLLRAVVSLVELSSHLDLFLSANLVLLLLPLQENRVVFVVLPL